MTVRLPDGTQVLCSEGDAARLQGLIDKRHAFSVKYCEERGWPTDPAQLRIDQILEIRRQPGWMAPGEVGK